MRIKLILLVGLMVVATVLVATYPYTLGKLDDPKFNWEYNQWKRGKSDYDPSLALRYLNIDVDFRLSLRGKSKNEIRVLFPDLRDPVRSNTYQEYYLDSIKGMDFLWIGDSAWGIEFEEVGLRQFHLLKG